MCFVSPFHVFSSIFLSMEKVLWCLQAELDGMETANNADLSSNLRSQTMYKVELVYFSPFLLDKLNERLLAKFVTTSSSYKQQITLGGFNLHYQYKMKY